MHMSENTDLQAVHLVLSFLSIDTHISLFPGKENDPLIPVLSGKEGLIRFLFTMRSSDFGDQPLTAPAVTPST